MCQIMKGILFVLFIVFSLGAFAQEPAMLWLKGIGGNNDEDGIYRQVTTTQDGGFIVNMYSVSDAGTGNIDSLCSIGGRKVIFAKYNADASIREWTKCYGQNGDSFIIYLFPTSDSGAVLGGEYNTTAPVNGLLIWKEDAVGNILWTHRYSKGNSIGLTDMIATKDGGYVMLGQVYYTDTNFIVHNSASLNGDIAVLKLDSLGNKVWSKAIGGSDDEVAYGIVENADSGYYIAGGTASDDYDCVGNHGAYDVYIVRLDRNGNIIWHRDLGGSDGEIGRAVTANGKGGLIVTAITGSSDGDISHPVAPNPGYWAIEMDSNRNIIWDNCYGGGGGYCYPNAVCKSIDGSVWLAGVNSHTGGGADTAYGGEDAWIVHTDSSGNFINAKVLGSNQQDEANMVYPLSNGNVITGGYYFDSSGSFSSIRYYGAIDDFLAVFSPSATSVRQVSDMGKSARAYPNPAKDIVNFETADVFFYSVQVYDVIGNMVFNNGRAKNIQIKVGDWPRGIYYAHVTGEEGGRCTLKLILD